MKIVMTLLVRNEDDILEDNLLFHIKKGVDFFIVMDHLSTDGTTGILQKYEKLGKLIRLEQTSSSYDQGVWVSQMAQMAYSEYGADWVINNDADEFWSPTRGDLISFFNKQDPSIGKLHINRLDYYYRPVEDIKFYNSMIFREWMCRWTKCCHRGAYDVKVEIGNHNAYSNEISTKYPKDIHVGDEIMIHHYPIRAYRRYRNKMEQGGKFIWNTPGLPYETGFHWKNALQKIENGTFEEYFASFVYGKDRLNTGIKDGSIVVDDTLQQFFSEKILNGN